MKVYGIYVKHYAIDVEVPDDATSEEIYNAVSDQIDLIYNTDLLEEFEVGEMIESIIDENYNYVWES